MVTGGGGRGGERRKPWVTAVCFSIFNTFSFHPTPEPGFRWPYTLHGRGWAEGGRRLRAPLPPRRPGVAPRGLRWRRGGWAAAALRAALPGGSGHYLELCSSLAAFVRRSVCLSVSFPPLDLVPAVWRLYSCC